MLTLPLPLRALLRDWRGGELTLISLALLVAVACISALNNFTSMVEHQLNQQAGQFLGADAVVTSKNPIPDAWKNSAQKLNLTQTNTLSFLSMVGHRDNLQLAQIKSIAPAYPLRGQLKIATTLAGQGVSVNAPPREGEVWLGARLFPALGITIGDAITIGLANFKVAGVVVEEPGQTGDWFNISPRIMMNQKDVAKTAVIQKGSNVTYSWLLAGNENQLLGLKNSLKNTITEQQWTDSKKNSVMVKTIERTLAYLNIGTLMSMVLAAVAISMASLRYTKRQQQQVAVLRCFGATSRDILFIYVGSVLFLGTAASLAGVFLGYALQPLLVHWLSGLLPHLESTHTLKPALLSFASGMVVLLCFTLVNLLKLRNVSATRIFRKEAPTTSVTESISYGLALLLLVVLAYWYTRSASITMIVLMGTLFYVLLAAGILIVSTTGMSFIKHFLPIKWHFGFTNIERNLANSTLQIVGIGLSLTAILCLALLKDNFLNEWQKQLPPEAPNFFIINIEPSQVSDISRFLTKNSIRGFMLYPMVKGRLISINNLPTRQVLGNKVEEINALKRELNFSWSEHLPPENTLTAGQWKDVQENWVSVEAGLAKQLGVKVNDTLGFRIDAQIMQAKITSIRRVNWSNFKPNFFILFKPGSLGKQAETYITSIYLSVNQQNKLLNLVKQFPNVTVIDVASTIKKLQGIFESASKAITLLTLFALLTGLIIAILAMLSFSDLKEQETALLKTLGMRKRTLLWIRSSESFIIGFYAGLLAICCAIIINYYLNRAILGLPLTTPWTLIIAVPFLTAGATVLINNLVMLSQYQRQRLR
ncbi:MAG: FtsX-like permease family protein [Legionella sp.]|nr:FtsX-like permease family protein [Legionella sp.]